MMMKMMTEKERKPNPPYPHVIDDVPNQTHRANTNAVRTATLHTPLGATTNVVLSQSPASTSSTLPATTHDNLATVSPRLQSSPIEKQQAHKYYNVDSSKNAHVVAAGNTVASAASAASSSSSSSAEASSSLAQPAHSPRDINGPSAYQVSSPNTQYNNLLDAAQHDTPGPQAVPNQYLNHPPGQSISIPSVTTLLNDHQPLVTAATHVIPLSPPYKPPFPPLFHLGADPLRSEQDSITINESDIDQDEYIAYNVLGQTAVDVNSVDDTTSRVSLSGTLDSQQVSPTLSNSSLQPLAIRSDIASSSKPSHSSRAINANPIISLPLSRPKKRVVFLRSPVMPPRDGNGGGNGGGGAGSRRTSAEPNQTVLQCDIEESEKIALNHPRNRQPRLSLHGKPISLRHHNRRDARYRKVQAKIYNFLERPRGVRAIAYHMLVFGLVFGCFCLTVISTVPDFEDSTQQPLFWMELIIVVWFTVEFLLRMWSVGCRSRYQGVQGRILFFKRPFTIIDTIVIVASIIVLGIGSHGQVFAASALRGLRFFQILRMVRMDRRGGTWKLLGSVVWAHRQELLTTFYIGFLGLIFASFLIYLVEKNDSPEERFTTVPLDPTLTRTTQLTSENCKERKNHFNTFADALWWGVITLATVGYGDTVPATWKGKLIAGICAMMGISFFALPASILGSGFALKVQQQQRQKHLIRRRNPAALLIQCMWRCYAADERSLSIATWEPHLKGLRQQSVPIVPTPSKFHHSSQSFVSRFSTIKRPKYSHANHVGPPGATAAGSPPTAGKSSALSATPTSRGIHGKSSSAVDLLRRDNSARKTLSAPLDAQPNRQESTTGNPTVHGRRMALTRTEDIRKALDPDDEDAASVDIVYQLSDVQRRAIRAIRKMKYFVAKRKFREALKPYDVKDVIEQYSAGHVDLLARVKNLQARCDQILGKQNSKSLDVYDSKVSLASRIVKIERQVDDIEGKIDTLVDLLIQQRNQTPNETSPGNPASSEVAKRVNPAHKPGKLRPILLNHQSSDPVFVNIPHTADQPTGGPLAARQGDTLMPKPLRPIGRGFSDLGLMKTVEEGSPGAGEAVLVNTADEPLSPPPNYTDSLVSLASTATHPTSSLLVPKNSESGVIDSSCDTSPVTMMSCAEEDEPAFIDEDSGASDGNPTGIKLQVNAPIS